jgi:hypothetical protein
LDFEVGDHVYVRVRQLKLYVGLASRES